MAKWDNENFNTEVPPNDIMCATCKHKLKPIVIGDFKQERYNYGMCDKYTRKPEEILWNHGLCPLFEKE